MKLRFLLLAVVLLSITAFIDHGFAQFEGEIRFEIVEQQRGNQAEGSNELRLTFTKDRIFIDSDESLNVMSGLSTSGILVRNDLQDFVLMTGHNEGLKIAKDELDGVAGLIDRVQSKSNMQMKPFAWDQRVSETGRTQQIHGYTTQQFLMRGDRDGEVISVWLTDQIKVNWGLLQEVWYSMGTTHFENEIPIEIVMNSTSFPLLVEVFIEDQQKFSASATMVENTNFDRSKTEVPSGHKLLSFTDLMMNFFRQQR